MKWLAAYGARRRLRQTSAAIVVIAMLPLAAHAAAAGAVTKAEAPERLVVAFGDSLMAGYRLAPAQGFAPRLEAALRRGGAAVRVYNAGVSGDTSAQGRARLGWVLAGLRTKPALVIVELGANDMLRALPPAQTRANLDAILAELARRRIPALIAGMRASPNLGRAYQMSFDGLYPALAGKYRVPLHPFFLDGLVGRRALLLDDGLHPNPAGVDRIVTGIAPAVRRALG